MKSFIDQRSIKCATIASTVVDRAHSAAALGIAMTVDDRCEPYTPGRSPSSRGSVGNVDLTHAMQTLTRKYKISKGRLTRALRPHEAHREQSDYGNDVSQHPWI